MNPDVPQVMPSRRMIDILTLLSGVGGLSFLGGLFLAPERLWSATLLVSIYMLGLGLAALFFISLQYVTGARWSTVLRRVPEAMTTMIPVASVFIVLTVLFGTSLYPWIADTESTGFKHLWLSRPFFIGRTFLYLLLWNGFAYAIVRNSRRQDEDGDRSYSHRNVRLSAGFIVVFTLTFWPASFDWIMSMEPDWYSTMFGVYNFSGLFLSGLAAIVLLTVYLQRSGPFSNVINESHLHDLGRLLFGFSTFWMYIWFCQYMLIWYAGIPEETEYFVHRLHGTWLYLFLLNPILNWVIPFFLLLPIPVKRNAGMMFKIAGIVLIGRWLDIYMMVYPASSDSVLGLWEIGMTAGAIGVFGLIFFRSLGNAPTIPEKDPYLAESFHHHV